jgi:hypothetical protein
VCVLWGREDKDIASIFINVLQCVWYGTESRKLLKVSCVCVKEVVSFALNLLQDKNIASIVIIVLQCVCYEAENIKILQPLSS